MKKDNVIQSFLDKYLDLKKVKSSSQMENFWEDVSKEHKENSDDIEISRKLNHTFTTVQEHEIQKKQDNHLQEFLNKLDYLETENTFANPDKQLGKILLKVAAVLIPFVLIASLTFSHFYKEKNYSAYEIVTTQKGSKTKIMLEDGTVVWLNAESEIKYPSTFKNKNKRVVELKGEAFFDVTKNEKKPFEVYASDYKIHVLGTSFNVKAYPDQETFETTLEEGKIDIEKVGKESSGIKSKKITLVPNQTIVLYKNQGRLKDKAGIQIKDSTKVVKNNLPKGKIIEIEDLSEYTSWKENELIFKSKSLGELIPDLERWFNIEITVTDESLNQIICTGNFNNETAEQVIEALSIASKINYEIDKNKVILKN